MVNVRSVLTRTAALALIGVASGCHGKGAPTAPTAPAYGASSTRIVKSAHIDGPDSIAPGGTAQFRYVKVYSDGTTEDATSQAFWTSSAPKVLLVDRGGLATAVSRGEAIIGARANVNAEHSTLVLEDGTFKVDGTVMEDGLPVNGVQVTVSSGVGRGLATQTLSDGVFAVYGVAGSATLQFSKNGYVPVTMPLDVGGAVHVPDVQVHQLSGPTDYSGHWRLTISQSPSCSGMPEDTASRSYDVTISQFGANAALELGSSTLPKPVTIAAHVTGNALDFTLGVIWDYYSVFGTFDVFETLQNARVLGVEGTVHLDGANLQPAGTMKGSFNVYARPGPFVTGLIKTCFAKDHAVAMTR